MSAVNVLRSILKLEENTLTVYGPAGTALWRGASWIYSAPPPSTPPFPTLTSEPVAHYSGHSLSSLRHHVPILSGSPLGRNIPAGVFPERAVFRPRIYERVPPMSSFFRRGLSGGHVTRLRPAFHIFLAKGRPRPVLPNLGMLSPPLDSHFEFSISPGRRHFKLGANPALDERPPGADPVGKHATGHVAAVC